MGISSSVGVGTGLNLTSLVNQLVAAEGQPVYTALDKREKLATASVSALGSIKSALSTFNDALKSLNSTSNLASLQATVADSSRLTATASASAVPGNYSMEVQSLAAPASLTTSASNASAALDSSGNGYLQIAPRSGAAWHLSIAATDTLANVRDKINSASDNPGITATVINADNGAHLVLTSTKIGTAGSFSITSSLWPDASADGTDATLLVNGQSITRSSNTISDAIDGVTLNLLKTTDSGSSTTLQVANDTSALQTKLNSVVTAYNKLQTLLKNQSSGYDSTDPSKTPLIGDAMVQALSRSLRTSFTGPGASATQDFKVAANFGLSVDRYGVMSLDTSKLSTAMANGGTLKLDKLLNASDGVVTRLNSYIKPYLDFNGNIDARTRSLNDQLKKISTSRTEQDDRLTKLQSNLSRQFQAMDSLVAGYNSTTSYLSSFINASK